MGKQAADTIVTIMAAGMMVRVSFDAEREADAIEQAVSDTLDAGFRTADILSSTDCVKVGCTRMGEEIANRIQ